MGKRDEQTFHPRGYTDSKLAHKKFQYLQSLGKMHIKTTMRYHQASMRIAKIKNGQQGFPGGAVVENLPANAGDTGSSPGLGRSHMPRSNQAHEPQLLGLRNWSLCSATREAAIVRGPRTVMKSGPRLPQLEKSPRTETKTQHSQ